MRTRRAVVAGALAGVLTLAVGCGGSGRRPTAPVHGRLTYGGKPMSGALISFYSVDPNDRAEPSHATADGDGRFTMETYRQNDGVPAGEYVVTVFWPGDKPKKAPPDPDDPNAGAPDRLKLAYASTRSSKLRATVRAGADNEINFNLP